MLKAAFFCLDLQVIVSDGEDDNNETDEQIKSFIFLFQLL